MVHVPYRGATPAIVDILGGRTDFMITNLADVTAPGAARAASGCWRSADAGGSALFPDVPPLAEPVPGFDVIGWFGICAPRGDAGRAGGRLEGALRQAMADPALPKRLAESGLSPRFEDAGDAGGAHRHRPADLAGGDPGGRGAGRITRRPGRGRVPGHKLVWFAGEVGRPRSRMGTDRPRCRACHAGFLISPA